MTKLLIAANALVAAVSSASADVIHRQVQSGATAVVWIYRNFDANCNEMAGTVKLVTRPAHGKISQHSAPSRIARVRFGGAQCIGQVLTGLEVRYHAPSGFHGTDTFTLEIDWTGNKRQATDTFIIDVQ